MLPHDVLTFRQGTLHKFASSRGTGVGKPHPGDQQIPFLGRQSGFVERDHAEAVQGQICASAREDLRPTVTQQIK
ncbi:hypothetical protein DPMN_137072 [Dreissena polymorpha]|uniref:Uncharacterized protein n=1 Tax=Dreissena polymorpha TaxID=45954 RepID=A0A9D4JEE9_DREPO|nr:hypothetical protein DPMN_137072 [Dreissena polymorpha]